MFFDSVICERSVSSCGCLHQEWSQGFYVMSSISELLDEFCKNFLKVQENVSF